MSILYQLCHKPWQSYKLNHYKKIVQQTNKLESSVTNLSDSELGDKVAELKLQARALPKITPILPELLAIGREVSKRMLNMRHYDCQLIGTLALYEGHIAEMDTGEGKTLMAPLSAFLHHASAVDRCCHIVTANEYLAQRDANWMEPLYKGLGLTVGLIMPQSGMQEKINAYQQHVVYSTARDIVFDSLREPVRKRQTGSVDAILRPDKQPELNPKYDFVIVDEIDSVLIDQARSPISLAGGTRVSGQIALYEKADEIAGQLNRGEHFRIMQDDRSIELKDEGKAASRKNVGALLRTLPSGHRWERYITCALAARYIYKKDQHYVIQDDKVVLIDESTGRLIPGRQLPDGIHQSIEQRNGLQPSAELKGTASTTFQTFFRKYPKLSGMTGSASVSAREFKSVYDLSIVPIPPNKLKQRKILNDQVYRTLKQKNLAILEKIEEIHKTGRPILIGTGSVLASERISNMLTERQLEHDVLNAKNHTREADIIAQAGQANRITIITNMAGRGVDILLGENIAQQGGMFLLGTDRSPLQRLDEQLTGRVGRQGDPGECQFFLSLKDDVLENADRKKICRYRKATRQKRDQAIQESGAVKIFHQTQKHNDKVARKQREKLYRSEKQREKLKEQGLWEDWMDAR